MGVEDKDFFSYIIQKVSFLNTPSATNAFHLTTVPVVVIFLLSSLLITDGACLYNRA